MLHWHQMQCQSGCGSVGRAFASDTQGPRFVSNHWPNFLYIYWTFVYCQLCIEKMKIKKKEAGNGPFFKKVRFIVLGNITNAVNKTGGLGQWAVYFFRCLCTYPTVPMNELERPSLPAKSFFRVTAGTGRPPLKMNQIIWRMETVKWKWKSRSCGTFWVKKIF